MHCHFGTTKFELVVIYAPQRGKGQEELECWWEHFARVLQQRDQNAALFILGDFNCSIGSVPSEGIGDVAVDFEDCGGTHLRELCSQHSLIVPSTFRCWHDGPSHTFVGARGSLSRIDYILVPESSMPGVVRSFVHHDFDVMNGDHDHLPLVVECEVSKGPKHVPGRLYKKVLYNRVHARTQDVQPLLHQMISNAPLQNWDCDVNDHWNNLRNHLQQGVMKCCPKLKRQRRQLYFSEQAWQKLCERKDLRQQYRALQRQKCWVILKSLFSCWKQCQGAVQEDQYGRLSLHMLRCQEALLYKQRLQLDLDFKLMKKRDWKKWVTQQLEQQVQAVNQAGAHELFNILKPKKMIAKNAGNLTKPLPGYKDGDGLWRQGRDEIAIAWQTQFSQLENGEDATIQDLLCRSGQSHHEPLKASDLQDLPTIYQLETALRNLNPSKAPGMDGLGAGILRVNPFDMAKKIFPILLKAAIRGQGVVEWAGGWLVPLFKGRGSPHAMTGYRAILLEPTISRAVSRAWRPRLILGLEKAVTPMQWGGRPGLSIEALHLHVQLWKRRAAAEKQSLAIVFLDIKAAFYSVIKQMVAGEAQGMKNIQTVFQKMNLPKEMYQSFLQQTQGVNLVEQATGSALTARHLASMLSHTWFGVQDAASLQAPMTGSRPGDPNADVLFTFVLAKVLRVIGSRAQERGIMLSRSTPSGEVSNVVTWVDDIALAVQTDAESLMSTVLELLGIAQDAMLEHGFELSYGVGKRQ